MRPKGIKPAKDLLANFLASKKSFNLETLIIDKREYSLDSEFISVYRYIFDVMDFNSFKAELDYQQVCNLSYQTIATYSRTSKRTVIRAVQYGVYVGILSFLSKEKRKKVKLIMGKIFAEVIHKNHPQDKSSVPGTLQLVSPGH